MIEEIKIGQKNVHFARHNGKVVYPNYAAKENLVLWYDFSGRTNLDVNKGIAEDLSGNGNDGILENFAYESGSGYDSNSYLEFDNVDDFITIPKLNLDVNNFTVAVDGEVLSYRGDNVAKINENGLEIGGRNLFLDKFYDNKDAHAPALNSNNDSLYPITQGNDEIGRWITGYRVSDNTFYVTTFINPPFTTGINNGTYSELLDLNRQVIQSVEVFCEVPVDIIFGSNDLVSIPANTWTILYSVLPSSITRPLGLAAARNPEIPLGTKIYHRNWKLEKGTKATDWSPAPEDFQTTKITPIFSNKIKTLMYWNRALTDT